ncbi:hypothetical protein Pla123a_13580 [Posidoniimonas polymericola]|uniref:Uncharacterized protein n=1 Tax=Posidoniimonas polymericola TaxID=2528002 RepID=A0A5C5YUD7_9BACT|nr:YihY/virulence factor BrkB family protein [Posidoniimonas polymericola]TWT78565.1 hypothetical protein Pla123a_13580 [Posidoniimonas polymericola]
MFGLLKQTFADFSEDGCPRMAAALAYYALFSLPPLLVIVVMIVGSVASMGSLVDNQQAREAIRREAADSVGEEAAKQIDQMIDKAQQAPRSALGVLGSVGIFLFGASGVMVQLQAALNEVWNVKPSPKRSGARRFVLKRLLSFAMVLGVGFVLLVSLVASTVMAALSKWITVYLPPGMTAMTPIVVSLSTDLLVAGLLFAAMFKWLPDALVRWSDVWIGAAVTALLFVVGKSVLALYFANANVGATYGAAGSVVLILAWVYYSGMIFLLGAEFTHAVAVKRHGAVRPARGAVVVETVVRDHATSAADRVRQESMASLEKPAGD